MTDNKLWILASKLLQDERFGGFIKTTADYLDPRDDVNWQYELHIMTNFGFILLRIVISFNLFAIYRRDPCSNKEFYLGSFTEEGAIERIIEIAGNKDDMNWL